MAESAAAPPKPSSSVKLVLLGEAAVGKVWVFCLPSSPPGVLQRQYGDGHGLMDLLRLAVIPRSPLCQ